MTAARDFWTRRKAAVAAEAEVESTARDASEEADARARFDGMSDTDLLEELNLPEPESLSAGDDFSGFMARSVPDRLRRRALRALWRTNPVLANVDGLIDYGGDFTDSATVVDNLQTAYSVGRGMLAHVERMAPPAAPQEVEAETEPDTIPEPDPEEPAMASAAPDEQDEAHDAPAPRRMTFTYTDETA